MDFEPLAVEFKFRHLGFGIIGIRNKINIFFIAWAEKIASGMTLPLF